ncbi:hypothetical protein [Streptomyces sp. NPDC021224]|uniref:phage tail protein n=1 Tax=unclassified Streptomyces TaxID=2593676 RepID=UPI00378824D4
MVPLHPDQPPGNPGAPSAADAAPVPQPAAVTDFSPGPKQTDEQMRSADVTDDQLARSNEPDFTGALKDKKQADAHSATAPGRARGAEKQQIAAAKSGAAASGAHAMAQLTATRHAAGKAVDSGKGGAKSRDESRRAEATARLQKVFDATKRDVEAILSGLDKKVDAQFSAGEAKARAAFETDQKARMSAYKHKRYGGWLGGAKWAKDKLLGMPKEANDLFQISRQVYVTQMQGVISSVADTIGTDLGAAKSRIAKGRADLTAEVNRLPADLKKYGQDAAKDFAGKFDDLESEVDDKSKELVQTLATKYTQALHKVDEEIKKLQDANKGLVSKAVGAIAGVIKTITELKNLLMGILAKAATAISKIIKNPIGFLNNLVHAVGAGLKLFLANIADHLKKGLVSWLLGTAVKAGLNLPASFDLKGIIQLITGLLGLTWANIRARITAKGIPDQAMTEVEKSVPVAQKLAKEGPAGVEQEIVKDVGDLKATILGKLTSYLIPTVIIAGITWILSLLNPASAFVRAVKAIVDIVSFVINQGAQVVEFVQAVLDAVIAIANGGTAGVPKMVETALAAAIPTLLGLLASLLGIGNLASKVKSVFHAVAKPVNRVIDKIVGFIVKIGKKIWAKLKSKLSKKKGGHNSKGKDTPESKQQRLTKGLAAARSAAQRLNRSGRFSRAALRTVFAAIKTRYGMTTLEPIARGTSWSARGTVNPTGEIGLDVDNSEAGDNDQDTQDPSDAHYLEMIRGALPKHAEKFSREAQESWNKTLREVEVDETPVWSEPPVQLAGLPSDAATLINNQEILKQLLGYFKEKSRKRSPNGAPSDTPADTGNFYNHAFRTGGPLREKMLLALGNAALQELKEPSDDRSTDATNQVNTMQYGVASGSFGKFAPLPGSGPGANKELEAMVTTKGGIIGFLRFVATESSEWNTKVFDLWMKHKPSKEYLMSLFREADSGKHEWIPTDYIPAVLLRAMSHLTQGDKLEAARWVALHHALRSRTEQVIWAIEGVSPKGHSGALWEQYVKDGKTKYKFTLTNGQEAFHNQLRSIFDQHHGSALQYVNVLRGRLKDADNPLIWNGRLDRHDPQFLDKPVAALVKTAVGIMELTVREFAVEQEMNFDDIMTDLDEADETVQEVS